MTLFAVRGATTLSEDTAEAMQQAMDRLMHDLLSQNGIESRDILTTWFTVTPDITALNPAMAVRAIRPDWAIVPMLCAQEPAIQGLPERCVRVLIQWQPDTPPEKVQPVYQGEARHLRPDLVSEGSPTS